eukprot:SAG11_NODE_2109_length_3809_cov_2.690027_2_plen_123_part_00
MVTMTLTMRSAGTPTMAIATNQAANGVVPARQELTALTARAGIWNATARASGPTTDIATNPTGAMRERTATTAATPRTRAPLPTTDRVTTPRAIGHIWDLGICAKTELTRSTVHVVSIWQLA